MHIILQILGYNKMLNITLTAISIQKKVLPHINAIHNLTGCKLQHTQNKYYITTHFCSDMRHLLHLHTKQSYGYIDTILYGN